MGQAPDWQSEWSYRGTACSRVHPVPINSKVCEQRQGPQFGTHHPGGTMGSLPVGSQVVKAGRLVRAHRQGTEMRTKWLSWTTLQCTDKARLGPTYEHLTAGQDLGA